MTKKIDVRLKFLVLHTKKWVVGWKNWVFGHIFWNFGPLPTPKPEKWGYPPKKWGPNPKNGSRTPKNGVFDPKMVIFDPKMGVPPKKGVETKCRFLGVKFHGFFLKKTSLKTMVFFRVRPKLCSNPRGTPRNSDRFWPNFDQKMGVF